MAEPLECLTTNLQDRGSNSVSEWYFAFYFTSFQSEYRPTLPEARHYMSV